MDLPTLSYREVPQTVGPADARCIPGVSKGFWSASSTPLRIRRMPAFTVRQRYVILRLLRMQFNLRNGQSHFILFLHPYVSQESPLKDVVDRMTKEIRKVVVGQDDAVQLALCAATVGGHILIEGVPGVAKTLFANTLARTMALTFKRTQFTPDMEPSDVTGKMGPGQLGTVFHRGPVFTNILLADEVNRTPPHTQAALLEAMQEHQVTVAGETHILPEPFLVIATQNPLNHAGTYPLPVSQLDRFLLRIQMDYPSEDEEVEILALEHHGVMPATLLDVATSITGADLLEARRVVDVTNVSPEMLRWIARLVQATRSATEFELGASPRSAVHLLAAAKAHARMEDRDQVTADDVERVVLPVLGHRVVPAQDANSRADAALRRLLVETRPLN